jgi:hypothetical protein
LFSLQILYGDGTIKFFGFKILFWIPTIILSVEFFLWLITLSLQELRDVRRRNISLINAEFFLFYITIIFFILGSILDPRDEMLKIKNSLLYFMFVKISLLLFLCPMFVCNKNVKKIGFFKNLMTNGIYYIILLLISGTVILGLTMIFLGIPSSVYNIKDFILCFAIMLSVIL